MWRNLAAAERTAPEGSTTARTQLLPLLTSSIPSVDNALEVHSEAKNAREGTLRGMRTIWSTAIGAIAYKRGSHLRPERCHAI